MSDALTEYYESYDEDGRLFRNNSHSVERLTTLHYMKCLIPPGSRIYDGCAGTGRYAFELARAGHHVTAADIVAHNVMLMRQKQKEFPSPALDAILEGDIRSLPQIPDGAFDIVLCMGAFYHLEADGRIKAMKESLRILKQGGLLFVTYINRAAALTAGLSDGSRRIGAVLEEYEADTPDGIFHYSSPSEMESIARNFNVNIIKHIAADGMVYLYGGRLNQASRPEFEQYMRLHLKLCEDRFLLGGSLHGLLVLGKPAREPGVKWG